MTEPTTAADSEGCGHVCGLTKRAHDFDDTDHPFEAEAIEETTAYQVGFHRGYKVGYLWGKRVAPTERATGAVDVERLLEAWVKHMKRFHPDDDYDDPTYECAKDTADEYARLSGESE